MLRSALVWLGFVPSASEEPHRYERGDSAKVTFAPRRPSIEAAASSGRKGDGTGEENADPGPSRPLSRRRRRSSVARSASVDRRVQAYSRNTSEGARNI